MPPRISVLIPVYNAGKYLPDCLQSVCNQTFTDFEIVCVDDGSTDGSLTVLRDLAAREPRLRIITQPNTGVAAARNKLIAQARAEYIVFVDADDVVMPTYLELLYAPVLNATLDMSLCTALSVPEDFRLTSEFRVPVCTRRGQYIGKDLLTRAQVGYRDGTVWGKLMRRQWLIDKKLTFADGFVAEDYLFILVAFLEADQIFQQFEQLYLYRKGIATSITSDQTKMLLAKYRHVFALRDQLQQRHLWNSRLADWWINALLRRIIGLRKVAAEEQQRNKERIRNALAALRKMRKTCGKAAQIKWAIFLKGAEILTGKSFYLWCKIFR